MSAWPACWAVSAMMCSSAAVPTSALGSNQGLGSGCGASRAAWRGEQFVGTAGDLAVVIEHRGQRVVGQHAKPAACASMELRRRSRARRVRAR